MNHVRTGLRKAALPLPVADEGGAAFPQRSKNARISVSPQRFSGTARWKVHEPVQTLANTLIFFSPREKKMQTSLLSRAKMCPLIRPRGARPPSPGGGRPDQRAGRGGGVVFAPSGACLSRREGGRFFTPFAFFRAFRVLPADSINVIFHFPIDFCKKYLTNCFCWCTLGMQSGTEGPAASDPILRKSACPESS